MASLRIGHGLKILQLNVEGISLDKCEVIARIAVDNDVDIILLQETHAKSEQDLSKRGIIDGFVLADSIPSPVYGIATYVCSRILEYDVTYKGSSNDIFIINLLIGGFNVSNVYKPPAVSWPSHVLPFPGHPFFLGGDLNSHHTQWGYSTNDTNGDMLVDWFDSNDMTLMFSAKDPTTFRSRRWNSGTNPDLSVISSSVSNIVQKKVLSVFPRSQHRPILTDIGLSISIFESCPNNRWNFEKAHWEDFSQELDHVVQFIPVDIHSYNRFVSLVKAIAKKHIPRGYRKQYIPGWNQKCNELYENYLETEDVDLGHELLAELNSCRKSKWMETVQQIDFKHSSRKAWSFLKKLGCVEQVKVPLCKVSANQIASRLVQNSKQFVAKARVKAVRKDFHETYKTLSVGTDFSREFTMEELDFGINNIKVKKAPGLDEMFAEFIKHFGPNTKHWILMFFNLILITGRLPKIFKKAKIITVLKPGKDGSDVSHYRPISLLSIVYKLLERLILNRIEPSIDMMLPKEQAAFRSGRSCDEQVLALTSFIERGFQHGLKTFVALIDLSSAYDTVWREGLLIKLTKLIPDKRLIKLLDNCLNNRLLQVYTNNGVSRWRRLNNGLPQGSVLSPVLYNVYTSDLPSTQSRKFLLADDKVLAIQT